jgi:hypothetical protein
VILPAELCIQKLDINPPQADKFSDLELHRRIEGGRKKKISRCDPLCPHLTGFEIEASKPDVEEIMGFHKRPNILAVAVNSIYLDAGTKPMTASGNPAGLLKTSRDKKVRDFLTRGGNSLIK